MARGLRQFVAAGRKSTVTNVTVENGNQDHTVPEAIEENPDKSNRAIAAELGISFETVRKVRNSTDNKLSVDPNRKRVGKDGKARKMPTVRLV